MSGHEEGDCSRQSEQQCERHGSQMISRLVRCYIRNLTSSVRQIDAYLLEEQSCQISSRSNLKWRSLGLFKNIGPATTTTRWLAIWNQFLIQQYSNAVLVQLYWSKMSQLHMEQYTVTMNMPTINMTPVAQYLGGITRLSWHWILECCSKHWSKMCH